MKFGGSFQNAKLFPPSQFLPLKKGELYRLYFHPYDWTRIYRRYTFLARLILADRIMLYRSIVSPLWLSLSGEGRGPLGEIMGTDEAVEEHGFDPKPLGQRFPDPRQR